MPKDFFLKGMEGLSEHERTDLIRIMGDEPAVFLYLQESFEKKCEALGSFDPKKIEGILSDEKEDVNRLLAQLKNEYGK